VDEMEEVRQRFAADVESYVTEVGRAAAETRELAGRAEEVKVASDGMRDKVLEAAAALKITRDEMGKLRNASGEVITAAEAQAMALKHIRDQALEAAFAMRELDKYEKPSLFSRLKGGIGGLLGGGGGGEGLSGAGGGLGGLGGIGGMLLAVEAAVMVIGPEVMALVTGLTAAGLGVGAFAALAAPAFGKVHSAYTQIQKDQQAYDRALTSKERATAMAHLKQDWASLDPAQAGAVRGVQQLVAGFQQMAKAFEPTAFKVFDEGLKIASSLMPQLQMFATAVTPAIEGALSGLGRFVTGVDFSQFMAFLQSLSGPVITAAASGLHGLALQVMQMMERFSKKDVINAVNIAFRVLGVSLRLVDGLIVMGMKSWDMLTGALHRVAHYFDDTRHAIASFAHDSAHYFDDFRHDAATAAHQVAHYWDDLRHGVAGLAHDIAVWFDRIRHDIAHWADDVVQFFVQLPGRMLHALGNLGSLLWNGGVSLIKGLISGIENAVPGLHSVLSWVSSLIPSWKGPLEADRQMLVPHGMAILQGFMAGVASQVPALHGMLAGIGASIPGALGPGRGGGLALAGSRVSVTVPLALAPGAQGYNDPRFLQYLQTVIQEAVLRYNVNNPGNGLAIATGGRGL
jgi:hypothetical protein